jgi:hypothetical protein
VQDRLLAISTPGELMGSLTLQVDGRIQGKGGDGGTIFGSVNGFPGGQAFLAEHQILITGSGEIWGGGGGGGANASGGSGGGGAGTNPGAGGFSYASSGSPGTPEAGGAGFNGAGAGGGPGLDGAYGGNGAGGAAGAAIDGVSLVTFDSPNLLDIRGAQIN